MEFVKMVKIYFFITILVMDVLTFGLEVTMTPESSFDDVDTTCANQTSSSLFPRTILANSNISSILNLMNVSESAWIGGERFKTGCQNDSSTNHNRQCSDILYERFPGSSLLNFTCVQEPNTTARLNSTEAKNYNEASTTCSRFGWLLPSLSRTVPTYKLPESLRSSVVGRQWFHSVDREYLKSSVQRECSVITKTDECSLRVEYKTCNAQLRGVCIAVPTVQFHDSLLFDEYTDENDTRETPPVKTEPNLCYKERSTESMTTQAPLPSTVNTVAIVTDSDISTESTDFESTEKSTQQTTTQTIAPDVHIITSTEPSPKPKEQQPSGDSKLWILAIILITLAIIAVIILIIALRNRKRRRSDVEQMEEISDNRNSTSSKRNRHSTNDVSAPLAGSLRKIKDKSGGAPGHESGIEVMANDQFDELHGQDIMVKDLDEDVEETKLGQDDTVQIISLKNSDGKENGETPKEEDAIHGKENETDEAESVSAGDDKTEDNEKTKTGSDSSFDKHEDNEKTKTMPDTSLDNTSEKEKDTETKEEEEDETDETTGLMVDITDT